VTPASRRSPLAAIRQVLPFPPRVPPFARAAFTGVVACGPGVATWAIGRDTGGAGNGGGTDGDRTIDSFVPEVRKAESVVQWCLLRPGFTSWASAAGG
jgi:hypothetical protein